MDEVEFVPREPEGAEHMSGGGMATVLSLPDWKVLGCEAEVRPLIVAGKPRVPGFALVFRAERHVVYFFWQAIVPLTLIVLMSWTPFWVNPEKGELQFGIASSAVLTLIAHRFALASMLPKLPYLTRMDHYTISATILVFAAFQEVLVTTLLAHGKRLKAARCVDYVSRVAFPLAAVALCYWAFFM
jgi:hypothetical protein